MYTRSRCFPLFSALALVVLLAGTAHAQRVKARAKPTVAGAKVKTWRAGNTKMTHETLRRGTQGPILHWRRSAQKVGSKSATVTGRTWGTPFKGKETVRADGSVHTSVTQFLGKGRKRQVDTHRSADGKDSITVIKEGGKVQRKIKNYTVRNKTFTRIKTYDVNGKLTSDLR